MNREEAIQFIKDELFVGENKVNELCEAVEILEQPITLVEFLGWEEGETYKVGWDGIREMSITDDEILIRKAGTKTKVTWDSQRNLPFLLNLFRNAEKVDKTKYYAKIKGWELAEGNIKYWNYTRFDNCLYLNTNSHNGSYETIFTKSEWNELGIDETNADFEEIEVEE